MNLDVNTLFQVTIYVEAILGLLLLFAWVQNSSIHAVAWWGFAHIIRAASVLLFGMYGSVPDLISIDLANALLFTAFAVTWTGAPAATLVGALTRRLVACAGENTPDQFRIFWVEATPPVPAVKPTSAELPPTVVGMSMVQEVVNTALVTVSVMVIFNVVPS